MNKVTLYLLLIASIFFGGFGAGYMTEKLHQANKETKQIVQQVQETVKKNDSLQDVATKSDKTQIVYRDKVVTQYQPVIKEVTKYVEKENSSNDIIWLDADWVRVHDSAVDATNGETEAPSGASQPDGTASQTGKIGIKSGDALKIIADNYQAYANCKAQVKGWQDFYTDLSNKFNETK